jgi:MFS family permease
MQESPVFAKLKAEKKTSINPLKESFGHKANFKMVLLALFGAVMGQGVIWYTGQFYAQSFLENTVKLEFMQNREILLWAIGLATPFFLVFGALSDKIGRKWIMLAGMLLGVLCYRPIFNELLKSADAKEWLSKNEGMRYVNIEGQKNPSVKYDTVKRNNETLVITHVKGVWQLSDGIKFTESYADTGALANNGNPKSYYSDQSGFLWISKDKKPVYSDKILTTGLKWKFIGLVWIMIIFVTMVYGPVAAFLVELFPTKIRYTSMSLPYHIGNGVFGGLVPFIATLLSATFTTDPLVGLWYPIGVAALCFVIGTLYLNNKIDKEVND